MCPYRCWDGLTTLSNEARGGRGEMGDHDGIADVP